MEFIELEQELSAQNTAPSVAFLRENNSKVY
jgi:hypothetical protein